MTAPNRERNKREDRPKASPTRMVTMQEVMERLQIGERTLRTLINDDPDFVTFKISRRRLISEEELERFINAKRQTKG